MVRSGYLSVNDLNEFAEVFHTQNPSELMDLQLINHSQKLIDLIYFPLKSDLLSIEIMPYF